MTRPAANVFGRKAVLTSVGERLAPKGPGLSGSASSCEVGIEGLGPYQRVAWGGGICDCANVDHSRGALDSNRHLMSKGPRPDVVCIEPPCLIAGTESEVEVHMSREVNVGLLIVSQDGHFVTDVSQPAERQKAIRISLPAFKSCRVRIAIHTNGYEHHQFVPCILSLPEPVAEEFHRLFARMEKAVCLNRKKSESQPAGKVSSPPLKPKRAHREQTRQAKEYVWWGHFAPLCSHFADLLEGLSAGNSHVHRGCAEMAGFFLKRRMWKSASFLLTACLESGASVTLGPYALLGEDVEAGRLRKDFPALSEGTAGLTVGEMAGTRVPDRLWNMEMFTYSSTCSEGRTARSRRHALGMRNGHLGG